MKINPLYILISIIALTIFIKLLEPNDVPILYLNNEVTSIDNDHEAIVDIERLNSINSKIFNFACDDIVIQIYNKFTGKISGSIAYEKDRHFKMEVSSFFGKEIDIGSNDDYFWFWSKRMKPQALYYANYVDLHKTRLKTPFHPLWIMESLGFNQIPTKDIIIQRQGNYWKIYEVRMSAMKKVIRKVTLLDPQRLVIIGHYIYDGDKLVASSEVRDFEYKNGTYIPTKIIINWYEEDVSMSWKLISPKTNSNIIKSWNMPSYNKTINMGID